jgi:leucyl/phenylalanyl-tRNA---protein transferase
MRHPLISDAEGLVCAANMKNIEALLTGYRFGLFPWYNHGDIGMFFFPHKRYIIKPSEIKIPKSIRPYFTQKRFNATMDQNFYKVIKSCMLAKRKDKGTWINEVYLDSYSSLHNLGYAHSLEVWQNDQLVGGLYGVAVGKIFTGESMFSLESNAARFAMISLALHLQQLGFEYIDCQVYNPFLSSFGGEEIDRFTFYNILQHNLTNKDNLGPWLLGSSILS